MAVHKDLEDPAQTVTIKEPEKPVEPEEPLTPEEPQKPAEPEKPQTVRRKTVTPASPETVPSKAAVKTGDDTNIALYLIPALVSALAIAGILIAKRSKKAHRK